MASQRPPSPDAALDADHTDARRPPVGRTLSESFAVIANRKHTLAVRNTDILFEKSPKVGGM